MNNPLINVIQHIYFLQFCFLILIIVGMSFKLGMRAYTQQLSIHRVFFVQQILVIVIIGIRYLWYLLGFIGANFHIFDPNQHLTDDQVILIELMSILAGIPLALLRLAEPYVWHQFKLQLKRIQYRLCGLDPQTIRTNDDYALAQFTFMAFMNKQANVQVVYQILYGLGQFHEAFAHHLNPMRYPGASQLIDKTYHGMQSCCWRRQDLDVGVKKIILDGMEYDDIKSWDVVRIKRTEYESN